MSIVRAYHAGSIDDIGLLLNRGSGLPESSARNNWLGSGIYFWDSDPRRAEYWQAIHGKGAILECELETELLIDMLTNDQRSNAFLDLAKKIIPTVGGANDRLNEYFGRDGEVVNRLRPVLQSQGYCGIRMAFCLGNPIAAYGNLFPNQHIQICLWDSSVIRNPKRYIPGLISE
jgi:hypothetical protein